MNPGAVKTDDLRAIRVGGRSRWSIGDAYVEGEIFDSWILDEWPRAHRTEDLFFDDSHEVQKGWHF